MIYITYLSTSLANKTPGESRDLPVRAGWRASRRDEVVEGELAASPAK